MSVFKQILPAVIVLIAGCTPVKLVMKVDADLEDNAVVYELSYPDSLADKISGNRLNVSFGPYRVADANLSWTRTNTEAEDPAPLVNIKNTKKSGNTSTTTEISGGPTSVFGFTRPAGEDEPSINEESRSITYKFNVGQKVAWSAYCTHYAKKRVTPYENTNSIEILTSNFTCQYKDAGNRVGDKSNNEVWTLTVDDDGAITMTQQGQPNTLIAYSTGGIYVMPDGKPAKSTTGTAGYTWNQSIDGNEKNIAAISVGEETPRVWLGKGNSETINQILSMANTGLLMYSWGIQQ
jgi:hypothetical protein